MAGADLLTILLAGDDAQGKEALARVRASRDQADRSLVADAERAVRQDPPKTITFDDDGVATVRVADRRYGGGRFATRSIGELRRAVVDRAVPGAPAPTLSVLEGSTLLTDIGALQAMAATDTLFQVASQFNCLEAPYAAIVPVADYIHDSTQGPRAAFSAFPGTLVRHYAAPDGRGGTFAQSAERQLNLLADALPREVGQAYNGYLRVEDLGDPDGAAAALAENADLIRVGVHDAVEVVLGANWWGAVEGTPRIAQAFTSTLAAGMYGAGEPVTGPLADVCRALLRAAYLGTLLAAVDLGRTRVVLTMIGGGAFGNPHALIWEAVLAAFDEVSALGAGPLTVVVNSRSISQSIDPAVVEADCRRRGGAFRKV